MAKSVKKIVTRAGARVRGLAGAAANAPVSISPVDEMLLAALEKGGNALETGRYLLTIKEGAGEQGIQSFGNQGMRMADARDFSNPSAVLESMSGSDGVYFAEIGVALVSGEAARERSMNTQMEIASDSPLESIDPEYFVFANGDSTEFLRGFLRATEVIAKELGTPDFKEKEAKEEAMVLGATWGLAACKVPPSTKSGSGIKVAILDTGLDLGHPDFAGRTITSASFVGQPVQDLMGHGTHCTGTACGPKAPAGAIPRFGIGYKTHIFSGKVLSNSGTGAQAGVLAGINWAIANRCQVISMSLGSPSPVHPAYTAAGQAALNNGCLIVAAAGNEHKPTGSPANSPTIMAVASLDSTLQPSSFSNFGKIDIAAPGRDIYSTWPRPVNYKIISGTSMATPHVAGCAALWAETSTALRGLALWRKLQSTARHLPLAASQVGAGLVQAP
jgi:subtilisin